MNENIPLCNIKIDKDGSWYYGDNEIFRKDIVYLFYRNLKRDPSGRYLIELGNERCYLDVEDAPFVVLSVNKCVSEGNTKETISMQLSDGTLEALDPETLFVGGKNVLYCSIRNQGFIARFSRSSYYLMANYIEHDPENDEYFISLNGKSFYIKKDSQT